MVEQMHLSSGPHIRTKRDARVIMLDVVIALLPAAVAGVYWFGLSALWVLLVSVASAVGAEALFNVLAKKEQTIGDFSAVVTGLLLGLNLPANVPLWQVVIGAVFAMVVVKGLFGGLGCNMVNPAITARVFMTIAFGSLAVPAFPADAVSSATPLAQLADGGVPNLWDLFIGHIGGAIGETCVPALLAGGVYLLARRVITWHLPVTFIGTVFVFSLLMEGGDVNAALAWVMSGGLMIGAIFMATDYVTSPATPWGKVVFGVSAGIITCLIRFFGTYPEGVSFAILLMNILDPYVDSLTAYRSWRR